MLIYGYKGKKLKTFNSLPTWGLFYFNLGFSAATIQLIMLKVDKYGDSAVKSVIIKVYVWEK